MPSNFTSRSLRMFLWPASGALLLLAAFSLPARAQAIQWIRQFGFGDPTYSPGSAEGVAVDATGVYVTGHFFGTVGPWWDAFVQRYDAAGKELWSREPGVYGRN